MGFGYLLFGYLIAFLLKLVAANLGMGGAAYLAGCLLMLLGLWSLNRYHSAFFWAKWLAVLLTVTALYDTLGDLDKLFLWGAAFLGDRVDAVFAWITFLLLMAFNLAMLYGIRMISKDLGLLQMTVAAVRNSFFVALFAILYLMGNLPLDFLESAKGYLVAPIVLCNLLWIFLNLLLLLACNKNICRAGDEDQPTKSSRIGLLNRMNEIYEQNRRRAIETTTRETEEKLRRRKEKRERKKIQHKKRK